MKNSATLTLSGELVTVGFRDALDQAVQAKAAQIVAHSPGVMVWVEAEQASQMARS